MRRDLRASALRPLFWFATLALGWSACAESEERLEHEHDDASTGGSSSGEHNTSSSSGAHNASSSGSSSGGHNASSSGSSSGERDAATDAPIDPPAEGCVSVLTLNTAPGATTTGIFEQCAETLDRPVAPMPDEDYAQCRVGGAFPLPTYYAYVELRNPSNREITVELRLDDPETSTWRYVYLAAYSKLPETEEERNACLTGVNGKCPNPIGLADDRWPCLIEDAAVTIPQGGSVWAYVPQHNPPSQPTGATPVRFTLIASVTLL